MLGLPTSNSDIPKEETPATAQESDLSLFYSNPLNVWTKRIYTLFNQE